MFFCSVRTRGNFSPALNVLSTTEPLVSDLSFVRTNAPPFPGLTCWNSTIRHVWPSSSMCIPLRNWFVETTSAIGGGGYRRPKGSLSADLEQLLRERGQELGSVLADDGQVLDPAAADAFEVDTRLDRDDVARLERVGRLGREPRRFVHLEAHSVAEAVAEVLAEAGVRDRLARQCVRLDTRQARLDVRARSLLR